MVRKAPFSFMASCVDARMSEEMAEGASHPHEHPFFTFGPLTSVYH